MSYNPPSTGLDIIATIKAELMSMPAPQLTELHGLLHSAGIGGYDASHRLHDLVRQCMDQRNI